LQFSTSRFRSLRRESARRVCYSHRHEFNNVQVGWTASSSNHIALHASGIGFMDAGEMTIATLSRILHVGTVIALVGGTFFMRFVLIPAATAELADDVHARLRAAVIGKWKKFVHGGIGLILLTGLYNYYLVITSGKHTGDSIYHALLGIKMLLAIVLFVLASALVGRSAIFEQFRKDSRRWLLVSLTIAATIVAISGFLKIRDVPHPSPPATATAAVQTL
jgi:uncharacterized membrane protein